MGIEVSENYKRPSPLKITKREAGYDYRWVSKDNKMFSMKKGMGYKPARSNDGSEANHAYGGNPDGTIQHGDLILCKIPKERAREIQKLNRMKAKQQMDATHRDDTKSGLKGKITTGR